MIDLFNYMCPECGRMLDTNEQFWQHMNRRHDYVKKSAGDLRFKVLKDGVHMCEICQKRLVVVQNNSNVLQLHYFSHLPQTNIYRCVYCKYAAARQTEMYHHLNSQHKEILVLSKRKIQPLSKEFYIRYQCPECGHIFEHSDDWLQHINERHNSTSVQLGMRPIVTRPNYYSCIQCEQILLGKERVVLQKHRFTHLPHSQYLHCAFCEYKNCTKFDIFEHFKTSHARCFAAARNVMEAPIEWGCKAKSHNKNTALEVKNLGADVEDNKVGDAINSVNDMSPDSLGLERHTHYLCPECGMEFEQQVAWRLHIKAMHKFDKLSYYAEVPDQAAYKCLHCFELLTTNQEFRLQRHRYLHSPYRAYLKCVHCQSCLTSPDKMSQHMVECHKEKYEVMQSWVNKLPDKITLFPGPLDLAKINEHLIKAHMRIATLNL